MKTLNIINRAFAGLPAMLGLILLAAAFVGCQSSGGKKCPCCSKAATPATAQAAPATNQTVAADASEIELFDGKTMAGWKVTDFAGTGEVEVKDGKLILHQGVMTGVNYTNPTPKMNYEVSYDACRPEGSDFFASLTFPVNDSCCTLITGGWGGGLVGISSLDGRDASENETTSYINFENGKWYHFRIRITKNKLQAWVDDKEVIKVDTTDKKIDVRPGDIESSKPFGFATWSTTGEIKNVILKKLE
jgi:hypothetical protein